LLIDDEDDDDDDDDEDLALRRRARKSKGNQHRGGRAARARKINEVGVVIQPQRRLRLTP